MPENPPYPVRVRKIRPSTEALCLVKWLSAPAKWPWLAPRSQCFRGLDDPHGDFARTADTDLWGGGFLPQRP